MRSRASAFSLSSACSHFADRLEGIDARASGSARPGRALGRDGAVQDVLSELPDIGLTMSAATVDPCGNICLTWCSPDYSGVYPDYHLVRDELFRALLLARRHHLLLSRHGAPVGRRTVPLRRSRRTRGARSIFRIDAVGSYTGGGPMAVGRAAQTLQSNRITVSVRSAQRPVILSFVANPASIPIGQPSTLSWSSSSPGSLCGVAASIDNGIGSVPAIGQTVVRPAQDDDLRLDRDGGGRFGEAKTTVTVDASCPVPGTPLLSAVSSTLSAGQMLALGWPAVSGLSNGRYDVEASRSPGFETLETAFSTTATNALVQTRASDQDYPLYVRIRAIQGCGDRPAGPCSRTMTVSCTAAPPHLVFTKAGPAWTAIVGGAPPSATVVVRNVGGQTASVSLTASGGFFDVPPASLWLPAGREADVHPDRARAGARHPGDLRRHADGRLAERPGRDVGHPAVAGAAAPGVKVTASTTRVVFSAPLGQTPEPQTVTLFVSRPAGHGLP